MTIDSAAPVQAFVAALRRARQECPDETALLNQVRALCERFAAGRAQWLDATMCRPDEQQGFGMHVLHEEADHTLAVFVVTWWPRRGTTPHDHGTWAVVAGLDGSERNVLWRRTDDHRLPGYAEVERAGEVPVGPGALIVLPTGTIHSVHNDTDGATVSLHVYGRHVNHNERSQFDPVTRTQTPYRVRVLD